MSLPEVEDELELLEDELLLVTSEELLLSLLEEELDDEELDDRLLLEELEFSADELDDDASWASPYPMLRLLPETRDRVPVAPEVWPLIVTGSSGSVDALKMSEETIVRIPVVAFHPTTAPDFVLSSNVSPT